MMGPTIPIQLVLLASLAGAPLPGAWFAVTLPMRTKNPYRLLFGPASLSGAITITRDDILREVKKVRDLFLMDYDDPSIGWTGRMEVRALNRSDIANVLLAYDTYASVGVYPRDLVPQLTELDTALDGHEGDDIAVQVTIEGGEGVRVSAVSQRAG